MIRDRLLEFTPSSGNRVCHLERAVRAKRLKLWRQWGVTVQHEGGGIETLPAEEAPAFRAGMPAEGRALSEKIEEAGRPAWVSSRHQAQRGQAALPPVGI